MIHFGGTSALHVGNTVMPLSFAAQSKHPESSRMLIENGPLQMGGISVMVSTRLGGVQRQLVTSDMSVACVDHPLTLLQHAASEGFLCIVTPLCWQEWDAALATAGCV